MSTEPIIIDLPIPPDCLHPNARPHWRRKAAATKTTRAQAALAAAPHRPSQPMTAARYRLEFRLPRKRDYDGLGSWVKSQIDGLVDAGLLTDDADFRPDGIERLSGRRATGGRYGVRFFIWSE